MQSDRLCFIGLQMPPTLHSMLHQSFADAVLVACMFADAMLFI